MRMNIAAALASAVAVTLLNGWVAVLPALAEETPEASAGAVSSAIDPQEIAARQKVLDGEIADMSAAFEDADDGDVRLHLEKALRVLRDIASILAQQSSLTPATHAQRTTYRFTPSEVPSIFALNSLYELRHELGRDERRREEAVDQSRKGLAEAREEFERAERERREARTAAEVAKGAERNAAERLHELRKLQSRLAAERVNLSTLELRAAETGSAGITAQEVDKEIGRMRAELARGLDDSGAGFAALTEREAAARRAREAAERRLTTAELRLDAAQKRFERSMDPSGASLEEVESMAAQRDAVRLEIALLDSRLARLGGQREVWKRWESLLRGSVSSEDTGEWKESLTARAESLEQDELRRRGRIADLESRIEGLQGRISALPRSATSRSALEEEHAGLSRLIDEERAEAAALGAERRLSLRVLADLDDGSIDLLGFAADGFRAAWDVWSYEVTAVDDAPITVGSLLIALVLASVGLWASRRVSAVVATLATERLRLDVGAAHALQNLVFYALLVSFTLLALRAVHFPLTAFTVLGGALAIGVGFGSQNIMNNFISGLILMLERPVRARDVVEVEGTHGTIEQIGARSTRLRSTDGRQLIVPNSFFLESNVVNWTLSDDLVRAKVTVGVIYGSPTRLVEELLRRVVDEEESILKHPEPIVIFNEFGDNSLNFDNYFWVRARSPMEMYKVASRVRFRIDDLFREHGLVIAFPQRDVHLDSSSPLEVRVINGEANPEDPSPGRTS